jgi:translation initiation factor IF-2
MSEGKKSIRLKQAAIEFNVGTSTIVDFLNKKGKQIENNPNARIDSEAYELLSVEYQTERQKKDKADSLQINIKKTETKIVAEENYKEEEKENTSTPAVEPEIIIKTSTIDYKEKPNKEKAQPKKEKTNKEKPSNNKQEKQPATKAEENNQQPTAKGPVITKSDKPEVITTKDGKQQISILGKIDLSSINTKTKPDKKPQKEREEERRKEKEKNKAKIKAEQKEKYKKENANNNKQKANKDNKGTKDKQTPIDNKKIEKKQDRKEIKKEEKKEVIKKEEKKEETNNFIATTYVKLTGPKITGEKVDLSQFQKNNNNNKKKSSNNNNNNKQGNKVEGEKGGDKERKKRKRIKSTTAAPINKGNYTQDNNNKFNKKDKKKFNNKKKDVRKKPEIADEEIEKQIKETLARLSPMGKSKTSKHRREKRQTISQQHQEELLQEEQEKKILKVTEFVTANELATMMNVPVTNIIASCMQLGMFVSINQRLDAEAIQLIADEFGYKIEFVSAEVVNTLDSEEEEDKEEDLQPRSPIVTVMGHVDHGKTSLLDYIRKTNVIAGEAGGITQHIGAYEVRLPHSGKKITFLDTPGHEAFTAMRARGAKMTDIAIIVVACDDKIMPQTIEAINHAQAAGVPIIFALNKIDKPGADPERIKGELANMNLLVEDWGGKIQSQEISAKKGTNVEQLLEKVLLEAEMLDLKGNPNKRAKGVVIESSLDKGRGYVAKILVQDGTIHQSDFVLAGTTFGRVKAMYNERNQILEEAGPSTPVLLLGLNGAPQAGDTFNVYKTRKKPKTLPINVSNYNVNKDFVLKNILLWTR